MTLLHNYKGDPFGGYFKELAQKFGVCVTNNMIHLPANIGSGFIKNVLLEENFCVRYYNLSLKKDIEFEIFDTQPSRDLTYKLVFNLYTVNDNEGEDSELSANNVLMYPTDLVRQGVITRNSNFRLLAIIFNTSWLNTNYYEAYEEVGALNNHLFSKNRPTIILEKMDSKTMFLMNKLAAEMGKPLYAPLHVKTMSLILLDDFLSKMVKKHKEDVYLNQSLHYSTMIRVAARIDKSIPQKLPNIEKLAAEFNLSLSTLTRHFRMVYGKNIYEYYQGKRMEWGKVQLERGESNVSEIATQLCFYKINNFSRAFKKHFGVLPRDLKKNILI